MRNLILASFYAALAFMACGDAVPSNMVQDTNGGDTFVPDDTAVVDTVNPVDTSDSSDTAAPADTAQPDTYTISIDCGDNVVQPFIYFLDNNGEWKSWYPGGTQTSDFTTSYTQDFTRESLYNEISTFVKDESGKSVEVGTIFGFDMGFRAPAISGWPWFGEQGAPAIEECEVKVNGMTPETNPSYPEWSGVLTLQVHL